MTRQLVAGEDYPDTYLTFRTSRDRYSPPLQEALAEV